MKRIMKKKNGTLLIIGGREDREGKARILAEVVIRTGKERLCIATVASRVGHELWKEYREAFRRLGARNISHLDVVDRKEQVDKKAMEALEGAHTVFFTGGDQLRITSELGGTKVADRISEIFSSGGMVAGTSAGASVMSETMLVGGRSEKSSKIGEGVKMAPGLGFLKGIIVDQHFSERGRIGRLLGAVALNPKFLGIGIDENTAILIEEESRFRTLGSGAVYIIDAHESTGSNISDNNPDRCLSISNVKCHVLSEPDCFNLETRKVFHFKRAG